MDPVTIMNTARFEKLEKALIELEERLLQLGKIDPLLTSKEVEAYLKKGSTWVDANKHNIGCSRIGGEWRFGQSDVDAYFVSGFYKNY